MRSAKIAPPPCLPFDFYIKLSTKPVRGRPLPSIDQRIESTDTITIICQRYLLNINSSSIDQYKGPIAPKLSDITITGALEITQKRSANQSVCVYYTGKPFEPPMLQPHELPYATVVTLVVTLLNPSRYHASPLLIIPLQNVQPKLLEERGTVQIADEPELSLDPTPGHHIMDQDSVYSGAPLTSVYATRRSTKSQSHSLSGLFYLLKTFLSV